MSGTVLGTPHQGAIRFGIIGLGVGRQHIPGYLAHPRAELAAVCDFSDEKLKEAQTAYPGVKTTKSAEEILQDPSISIVSIASYDRDHAQQILLALANGKHVFAEKPLCVSADELKAIRAAHAKAPHLKISSNLILRRYHRFLELKERIDQGKLGRLYNLEADYNYGRLEKIHQGWRGEQNYSVVLGGAIHMVDLAQWLSGQAITEVAAFGNRICSEGSKFAGNDMVTAVVKFADGAVGKINANFGCVFPHMHRLALYGTKGTFVNDIPGGSYVFSRAEPGQPEASNTPYPGARKGDMLRDFVESIAQNRESEISLTDLFSSVAVCLAMEKSVREGRSVQVSELL